MLANILNKLCRILCETVVRCMQCTMHTRELAFNHLWGKIHREIYLTSLQRCLTEIKGVARIPTNTYDGKLHKNS